MRKITLSEYNSIPKDYRGIWTGGALGLAELGGNTRKTHGKAHHDGI